MKLAHINIANIVYDCHSKTVHRSMCRQTFLPSSNTFYFKSKKNHFFSSVLLDKLRTLTMNFNSSITTGLLNDWITTAHVTAIILLR